MEEIIKLINNISLVLQYIAPGYLTLLIFYFSLGKKIDNKSKLIPGCLISYILISFVVFLRTQNSYLMSLPNNEFINSIFAFIIGAIFFTLIGIIIKIPVITKIFVFLYHRTINQNIWQDIIDSYNGSNLKLFLKDKKYYVIGHMRNYEENKKECWIAINAFGKYDKNTNQPYNDEPPFLDKENFIYVVRFSDIEHIEVFN